GVGKTLTTKSLAKHLKRPLYLVRAYPVKNCLLELTYTVKGNVVLLLDEADVYLEKRTTKNVARNALMSVFLRELEFFGSLLILITNRLDNFNSAILSRL
ncbi:hypothetical protein M409DRAFT_34319, partial [Zasmidium cellare ATCC 36951]